jgi:hypothetical protein
MTLVAILTVRKDALDAVRAFERRAAAVMAARGGRIERTVVAPGDAPDLIEEIRVVTFPDTAAFGAYRGDARLAELVPLRAASVVRTELLLGEDGPRYARREDGRRAHARARQRGGAAPDARRRLPRSR